MTLVDINSNNSVVKKKTRRKVSRKKASTSAPPVSSSSHTEDEEMHEDDGELAAELDDTALEPLESPVQGRDIRCENNTACTVDSRKNELSSSTPPVLPEHSATDLAPIHKARAFVESSSDTLPSLHDSVLEVMPEGV